MSLGIVALNGQLPIAVLCDDAANGLIYPDNVPTYQVFSPAWTVLLSGQMALTYGTVTGATAASPIVITSPNHKLESGAFVKTDVIGGVTGANGEFQITKIDADTFSLNGSTGTGSYTSGGIWAPLGFFKQTLNVTEAAGFVAGNIYHTIINWSKGTVKRGVLHSFQVA